MSLLTTLRDTRELLGLGRDIVELLLQIGRLLKAGEEQTAEAVLASRNREQAAGRAREASSRATGPRRSN
jgi:hypothetical protein